METRLIEWFRLSPQQRLLWQQMERASGEGGEDFCAQAQVLLAGRLDAGRLARALGGVVAGHEILRTRFPIPPGMKLPVQSIAEERPVELAESDLRGLALEAQEAYLAETFTEALAWPFDLGREIALSASLITLAEERAILFLRLPALCSDAAGLRNLIAEIARAYGGSVPASEEETPAQYVDLAEWQHELLESEDTATGREHWQRRLAEPMEGAALPLRRAIPAAASEPQAVQTVEIPLARLGPAVDSVAGRLGVPVEAVLLAAWAALLQRWSERPALELHLSCDGRRHGVLRGSLGLLAKLLPLRLRVAPEDTFETLVRRVAEEAEEASRFHEYFDAATFPLSAGAAGFDFADWAERHPTDGLVFSVRRASVRWARPVLHLSCWRAAEGLAGRLHFDPARLEAAEAERLAERLVAFLAGALADSGREIAAVPALGAAERRLLFEELNDSARPFPETSSLHQLFAEQVARTAEEPAVTFEGTTWSYGELDRRAERMADRLTSALRKMGEGPEPRIGVFVERSLEMVAAILGVLKAGAALVPLDPSYPAERLAFMVEDARMPLVVTQRSLLGACGALGAATPLCVDDDPAESEEPEVAGSVSPQTLSSASLAYVIYTSGSTGRPKGVMIAHAAICNHLRWLQETYALQPGERTLQKTPLSFDVAVRELFWPLTSGALLVVARPGGHQDTHYLARLAAEERIAVLNFVPSLLRAFVEEPAAADLPALRRIISGGEALPPSLRDRCFARLGVPLHNHYGPTETTVTATYWTLDPADRRESVPIGRPLANTHVYVLDGAMRPVFLGAAGELYVGGAGLARGYLGRPDLTAELFLPSPNGTGERLYRTGDLVRVLPEGALEYLGRLDDQIKIRGLRVELGEIESVLAAAPGVAQALVVAREAAPGDLRLVAYLVPRSGAGPLHGEEVRRHARALLPDYMVPAFFVVLERLPLNPTGKVDRASLPDPEAPREDPAAAPRSQVEELLAGLFRQLLGRRSVGRDDDFFALGGHSLLGTQLIARVREAFRIDLPLRTFFEAPTVARLGERIEVLLRGTAAAAPPLGPVARRGDLPLSFAQRRLWFLDHLEPGSAAYNIPGAVRLRGTLDLAALDAVLSEIVRRHEALRTIFPARAGQPSQLILAVAALRAPLVDLAALPAELRERAALDLAAAEARTPFDLAGGPLLRLRFLRLGAADHLVLVSLHHIVSDGWSRGALVREVVALYRAVAQGEPSPLPELPIQYADYAAWQQAWLAGATLDAEMDYWRRQLSSGGGGELLQLPFDRPRPAVYSHRGRRLAIAWPAELAAAVAALGRERGATLFMTHLALFQALLARYTGQDVIRVGTPIAGRDRVELEALIGFFTNTLVLATDVSGSPSIGDLLRRVRDTALDAHRHQNLPFERLVDELQPRRDLSHTPLFQVAFVLQNAPQERFALPGLELSLVDLETGTAKFDLTLNLSDGGSDERGGLSGVLEYNTDLFDEATIARAAGHLERLATEAARHPESPLWELPLLTEAERESLLFAAAIRDSYAATECLHEIFAARAHAAPQSVALRCDGEEMTYGELERRANDLARRLALLGVGCDDLVALCAEPSFDLPVGILGILKAGAAYLPLDPSYPEERLAFYLEDSGAVALVGRRHLVDRLPSGVPRVDLAEVETDAATGMPLPAHRGTPAQRAYVIYTSGSTGRPKGVAVSHANAVRLFAATDAWFDFGPDDVWTLFHSSSFDFSVWEIWGALLYGGRLVIVPHAVSRSPEAFYALLGSEGVTSLSQTPSAFRQLIRAAVESGERVPSLRCVVFGGEALETRMLRPWFDLYGDRQPRLINMYGITETTVHVTYRPIERADLEAPGSRIGVPIPDLALHLLDRAGGLVPVGVAGEMCVGGAGVARGYLGRPELTARRFVPDPWSSEPGARLYRSGDLARRTSSGDLEYLGRIDEQVKIRGFRIELGEIESALADLPQVAGATVLARTDDRGGRRLVAYVVTAGGLLGIETLRRALAERLPDYMVPAQIVFLAELPLTGNGKLDRRALPDPAAERPDLGAAYRAPSTPAEEILAGVWSRVLGVDRVGVHDNFFALGGDSILSLQIVALARERGLEVSLHQIFQQQTIAELAPLAAMAGGGDGCSMAECLEPFALIDAADRGRLPAGVEDAYPLARLQDGMLFHLRLATEEQPYHNIDSFHLRGPLSPEALAEAWRRVVARHPVLRTAFDFTAYGEPLQLVYAASSPDIELGLEVEDLRGLSEAEQEERIERFLAGRRSQPLDLARPPLLRLHVHLRTSDTFQLTLIENHAILDGWSLHATLAEVFRLQLALRAGEDPAPEPPPAVHFRDFVQLERLALEAEEPRRFWAERIEGAEPLRLPRGASPRSMELGPRIVLRRIAIADDLADRLRAAARIAAVPLKSALLAAHLKTLALASGQDDVVSGLVTNGRPEREGGDEARGLFLNTVPFRLRLSGGSWAELMQQVFDEERSILPHRRYPLAAIQGARREPLFEAAFNYIHFHVVGETLKLGGYELLETRIREATNFVLSATFGLDPASGDALFLQAAFDARRLDRVQIERLERLYLEALEALAAGPQEAHGSLSGLSAAERHCLVAEWNIPAAVRRLPSLPVQELIFRQARATPDRIAVVRGEETLDFAKLESRAFQVRESLELLGVGPEDRVALFLRPDIDLVPAILGVLASGAAYVPIDVAYPKARIEWLLADAGAAALITEESLLSLLPDHHAHVLTLESLADLLVEKGDDAEEDPGSVPSQWRRGRSRTEPERVRPQARALVLAPAGRQGSGSARRAIRRPQEPSQDPVVRPELSAPDVHDASLAYVIYTSGSTGTPNGVMVSHGALRHYLEWCLERYLLAEGSGAPVHSSIGFDLTVTALFAPLLAGASVTLLDPSTGAADLQAALVAEPDFSFVKLTPAHLRLLCESPTIPSARAARSLIVGGEALLGESVAAWRHIAPAVRVFNEYGPTEATVGCCVQEVPSGDPEPGPVPIGWPIAGMEMHLLDGRGDLTPPGAVGEIYIAGIGLARGYLGRPELTAERFVPHLYAAKPGERLYRTGDLARRLPDGRLVFLGRRDHQVKVRGYRIELGEIEAALERQPAVGQAVVLVREEAADEARLVAFVTPRAGARVESGAVREAVRRELPSYLVPAAVTVLAELPLTEHGKVDRRRLLALVPEQETVAPHVPAAGGSATEEILTALWCELLQVETVGADDSFFDLGGHSLLASRLLAQVARLFAVELPLRALFDQPTIRTLARRVEAERRRGRSEIPPLVPAPRDEPPPLSFAQQRLWFLDQLEPGSAAYNVPLAVRVEGDLDVAALASALSEVVRRHETLRTHFAEIAGEPRQMVDAARPVAVPTVDLAALGDSVGEGEARRLAAAEAARAFDLGRGPLLRVLAIRLGGDRHLLLLTLHHIVSDGWSLDVLVRELSALYSAARSGLPSPLPELPVQYADFALWQRRWLHGDELERQLDGWRRQLAGAPPPNRLPFRRQLEGAVSARGAHRSFVVPAALTTALRRLAAAEKVTLYMVCLAAFEALLHRVTGATDLLIGTDLANRRRPEVEGLIGFFVNVLPVRLSLAGYPTFRELLARVREGFLEVDAHQDVPLEKLVEALAPGRGQGASPWFEMLFVFVPPSRPAPLEELVLQPFESGFETSRFDLVLFMSETAEEIRGSFAYRTDLFAAADVERLAARFEALLARAAESPAARIDDLDVFVDSARREQAMEQEERELGSFSKFKRIKPKAVTLAPGELVRTSHLGAEGTMPLVVEPALPDLDLAGWAAEHPEHFAGNLARYGAIHFRGCHLPTVEEFERFAGAVCPSLFGEYGDLPRAGQGKKVYNSTPYPADKTILFHNESSHMHRWPRLQFFYCVTPSASGGETPIVDGRRIYQRLELGLRARLEEKGLLYVRNFTPGLDVSWQDFFMTEEPSEVEAYCRANGVELAWFGERLRTRQKAPAVITHPRTGDKVFFNQIQLHHVSCIEPGVRESLAALFAPDELPRNVFYGDGSPIADADVQAILELYWQESAAFPWQKGDALALDNMLVAHARNPFAGTRKIAVAMGEMFRQEQLQGA
jgi:amino acid adenylation domain-containing protein